MASRPPGPPLPPLVQTVGFLASPRRFFDACRRRYGDVVWFSTVFDRGFAMVYEPELVKQVFHAPPERLRAGEANVVLAPLLGEHSVLLADGASHLRQRKLMLPSFHGRRLEAHAAQMLAAADREIDRWPVGEPFSLLRAMQSATLDVIMRAIFGLEDGARAEELKRAVRGAVDPIDRRAAMLAMAMSGGRFGGRRTVERFNARKRVLDEQIYAEIARRRAQTDLEERDDVMSTLLGARDEEGEGLGDRELRDELVTLLVAGHETTATGLAWAVDLLLHDERALRTLRARLADGDERYLDAVVKEALRLRPVVPGVGRVVRGGPFELGGYEIPEGAEINPSISTIHRRADRYPQPAAFRPERFLAEDAPDTYTWVPFGGGTRRCLGASFALTEMRIVLRRVVERTDLVAVRRRPERVQRRGITLVPRDGVRVVQRRAPAPAKSADAPSAAAVSLA